METRRPAVDRARRRVVRKGGQGRRRGSAGAYRPRSIQRIFRVSSARDLARADIAMGLPESLQLFDETPVKGATKKISRRFRGSQVCRGLAAGGSRIRTPSPALRKPSTRNRWFARLLAGGDGFELAVPRRSPDTPAVGVRVTHHWREMDASPLSPAHGQLCARCCEGVSLTRAPLRRRPNAEPNDGFPRAP